MREDAEVAAIRERYARRAAQGHGRRYSMLDAANWQTVQERQRRIIQFLASARLPVLNEVRLLEVGCGHGGNLLEMIQLGLKPANLGGIELIGERLDVARSRLPGDVTLIAGDAMQASIPEGSQDIVYQSVVFSSLLDDRFQEELAARMWTWIRPGGAVLWYDFIYDNPSNRDVRGVPLKRVGRLFPQAEIRSRRVTLAPPIARRACSMSPFLYTLLNGLPWLRTHVLCWIQKS